MKAKTAFACVILMILLLSTLLPLSNSKAKSQAKQEINNINKLRLVSEHLEVGDLLFMDVKPIWCRIFSQMDAEEMEGRANDHVAMYIGDNMFIETNDYSGWFPWKKDGVQKTHILLFALWATNLTIGKVNGADYNTRQKAISFAINQTGCMYQWGWPNMSNYMSWHANPNITNASSPFYEKYHYPEDQYVDFWYCSELVWAAYLHQEIQLDGLNLSDNEGHYWIGCDSLLASEKLTVCDYWNQKSLEYN